MGEMQFNKELEYNRDTTSISLYDLMSIEDFKQAVLEDDIDKAEKLLYGVGVDLSYGYTIANRLHRPLMSDSNTPVEGSVLIYMERTDKEWVNSGHATMEATINSSSDMYLREDLWRMQDAYLSMEKVKAKADSY